MAPTSRRIAGIDIGGTFTDLLLLEEVGTSRRTRLAKIPTTPDNRGNAVLAALEAVGVAPRKLTSSSTARPPPPTPY